MDPLKKKVKSPNCKETAKKRHRKKLVKRAKSDEVLSDETIAHLTRELSRYEWIELASLLGFPNHSIGYIVQRASSSDNHLSQCQLMLSTWRQWVPEHELIARLCDALVRMRRVDLAVKFGTDMALGKLEHAKDTKPKNKKKKNILLTTRTNHIQGPPLSEKTERSFAQLCDSERVFPDAKLERLARSLPGREEWKRLAFALGILPKDVAHTIGRASSGDNRFVQACYMLKMWRKGSEAGEISGKLKAALTLIRRKDLVHLLALGFFTTALSSESDHKKAASRVSTKLGRKEKNVVGDLMVTHIPKH